MTDPIDYSRPVGWWCAYCEEDGPCTRTAFGIPMACKHIPRYLPLPVPEPVEVDEVETGEAEVVTKNGTMEQWIVCAVDGSCVRLPLGSFHRNWSIGEHINDIAAASANARKKREGAK